MKGTRLYRGQYILGDLIASGGFAKIHRAVEVGREEEVALKICARHDDMTYALSIKREAELIQRFNHRNIIRLYPITRPKKASVYYANAVELPSAPVFFVMEYLKGGTLENYLYRVEQISPAEAATIALELARALDHIHLKNYAHNDLKLENVVFREPVEAGKPFTPVLVDFGIATRVLPPRGGTLYIMPPEQLRQLNMETPPEQAQVDARKVDVWGLGVVLYRMLGGKLPFTGRREKTLTDRIKNSRPTSLRKLSRQMTAGLDSLIIDGCLAKKPGDRLSLLAVGRELKKWAGDGVPAQTDGRTSQPTSRKWFFNRK